MKTIQHPMPELSILKIGSTDSFTMSGVGGWGSQHVLDPFFNLVASHTSK